MSERASFLDLPARTGKPRSAGITMVLDKGMPIPWVEPLLGLAGGFVDIWKMGWGTAYLEPDIAGKVELLRRHGIRASVGGTLLEIAWAVAAAAGGRVAAAGARARGDGERVAVVGARAGGDGGGAGWVPG